MGTQHLNGTLEGEAAALLDGNKEKLAHGYHGVDHDHNDAAGGPHDHSDHVHSILARDSGVGPHAPDNYVLRRLKIATALCFTFMVVEVIGGLWAGSLAVLSDAAHLTADLASFAVAIVAAYLAAQPSTVHHTYGLKRSESLAALFSMTCLAVISIGLVIEAIHRIYEIAYYDDSTDVDGKLMSGIATIGVLVNLVLAAVLGEHHVHLPGGDHGHSHDGDHGHGHDHEHGSCGGSHEVLADPFHGTSHDHGSEHVLPIHSDEATPHSSKKQDQHNLNLRAAYLHVMADLAQSVAVLIAGLIIWAKPHWKIVDPIATILFCILVFYSTLGVIRSAVGVLLEGTPPDVSWHKIRDAMQMTPGVTNVHDLHIWSISHGISALSVHIQTTSTRVNAKQVLKTVASICRNNGIQHTTIQIQPFCNIDNGCITCGMADETQACVVSGECCADPNCADSNYEVDEFCQKASNKKAGTVDAISDTGNSTPVSTCSTGCC